MSIYKRLSTMNLYDVKICLISTYKEMSLVTRVPYL